VGKYATAVQATDDNIIRRMRFECWITMVINTHSEYVYVLLFHCNNGYAKASQCYVIRTLPVLLICTGSVISSVLSRGGGGDFAI